MRFSFVALDVYDASSYTLNNICCIFKTLHCVLIYCGLKIKQWKGLFFEFNVIIKHGKKPERNSAVKLDSVPEPNALSLSLTAGK